MARKKSRFYCTECGLETAQWLGKCPGCQSCSTLVEEKFTGSAKSPVSRSRVVSRPVSLTEATIVVKERLKTGISELDRVLGGGLVSGSVVLLGGEPGIGKSTLVLQLSEKLARDNQRILYVSGEESLGQVKVRAGRLDIRSPEIYFYSETDVELIENQIEKFKPAVVCVDSIQTLYDTEVPSPPGSLNQVRQTSARLLYQAKRLGIPVLLVGHVTKGGLIAGPRVLEHMVDTVLYFEGDSNHTYRILRAVKNRFGSTNEIGVFDMRDIGLVEVKDPSSLFLGQRDEEKSGSVVVPTIEGSRPFLVELQALVCPTNYVNAQRVLIGPDTKRVALIMAVLEKKLGVSFLGQDIFINLAGGLKSAETAIDLGLALALLSSFWDVALPRDLLIGGEVGLGGEIRGISQLDKRLHEAAKLGFTKAVIPRVNADKIKPPKGLEVVAVKSLEMAIDITLKGGR